MKIWLDDEREPPEHRHFDVKVRNYDQFVEIVDNATTIDFVAFDHDLGYNEKTGHDCAKYLVETDMDRGILSENFSISVHSMNPVGARNIEMLIGNYLREKGKFG